MRTLLQFIALIAAGLIGAVAVAGGALEGLDPDAVAAGVQRWRGLDLVSLLIGLAAGVMLGALSGVGWASLPGRLLNWIAARMRVVRWAGWAVAAMTVLLYY
jgi:hypothetical protein